MDFEKPKRLSALVELNSDMWHHGYRSMDGWGDGKRQSSLLLPESGQPRAAEVDGILQNGPVRKCTA